MNNPKKSVIEKHAFQITFCIILYIDQISCMDSKEIRHL